MNSKIAVRVVAIVLAVILVGSVFAIAIPMIANAADAVPTKGGSGYITADYVNLRKGAGTGYAVVTTMRKNTKVVFTDGKLVNSGWYQITEKTGNNKGYVYKDYVKADAASSSTSPTTSTSSATGYINVDYVNLRKGAGTGYAVVTTMRKNTKFTFVSEKAVSGWYNIKLSNGTTGYVYGTYVTKDSVPSTATPASTPSTTAKTGYVNTDYVNLRKGAGTGYAVITTMRKNTKFTFVSTKATNGWYHIKLSNGTTGYIFGDYATADKTTSATTPASTAPSATAHVTTEPATTSAATTGYINVDYVNLRKGAGTGYAVITTMRINTKFTFVSTKAANGWYKIKLSNGTTGYVYSSYATADKASTAVTTPATTQPASTSGGTSSKLSISNTKETIYTGNKLALTAAGGSSVKWTSSNTSVATVDSNGIVTAKAAGTATIKATSGSSSVSCAVTVKSKSGGISLSTSNVGSLPSGKSLLLTAYNHTGWKSSNSKIATVSGGVVEAVGTGYVSIFAYNSFGMESCVIHVTDKEAVRFSYASPNSAPKNSTVTLKAITDSSKTAVRFVVSKGTEKYTINAKSKVKDGSNLLWTATQKLSTSGEWKITAYSKVGSGSYQTNSEGGEASVFVTNSTDKTTTVTGERRASDEVIELIADFEGFLSELTDDYITGDPTIGYGRVIYRNEQFYNNLSKNEAFAYLCQTVNSGGYTSRTNAFLTDNKVKFNQQQFDALVCFAYNVGSYAIYNDSTLQSVLLNSSASGGTVKSGASGFVNSDCVNLRKGAGTSYAVLKTMSINTTFTFVEAKLYNSNWYKVKLSDGTTGYIYSSYASVKGSGADLNNINEQAFIKALLQYHHAAGSCYWGLLYRRIDEVEIFLYGDYERDGWYNYNNFSFTCSGNSGFYIY